MSGIITPDDAESFYEQSKQGDFTLTWQQVIMDDALNYIKLRVLTSANTLKITNEEAQNWDSEKLTTKEMASLIYLLFGKTLMSETAVQILNTVNEFNFGFDLMNKQVEEKSHQNIVKLLTDHYGPLHKISPETRNQIAKLLYRKVPAHSELNKMFLDATK